MCDPEEERNQFAPVWQYEFFVGALVKKFYQCTGGIYGFINYAYEFIIGIGYYGIVGYWDHGLTFMVSVLFSGAFKFKVCSLISKIVFDLGASLLDDARHCIEIVH